MNISRKKLFLLLKGVNFLAGVAVLGFVLYWFSGKHYVITDEVVEVGVSMHYDFKILDAHEGSFYNFDGMTREGKRVTFKIPKLWNLEGVYSVGDSICKVSGDSTLRVVKPNGTISLKINK